MTRLRARRIAARDDGNAIVEFIFVAVLVFVPLIYLIVAVAVIQRARLATSNAARDVGRAIATSESADQADQRAQAALRIAIAQSGSSAGRRAVAVRRGRRGLPGRARRCCRHWRPGRCSGYA